MYGKTGPLKLQFELWLKERKIKLPTFASLLLKYRSSWCRVGIGTGSRVVFGRPSIPLAPSRVVALPVNILLLVWATPYWKCWLGHVGISGIVVGPVWERGHTFQQQGPRALLSWCVSLALFLSVPHLEHVAHFRWVFTLRLPNSAKSSYLIRWNLPSFLVQLRKTE